MQTIYDGVYSLHLHCKNVHCVASHFYFQAFSKDNGLTMSRFTPFHKEVNAGKVK